MFKFLQKLHVRWILLLVKKDGLKERIYKIDDSEIPPPKLRFKVNGSTDLESYLAVATELKNDIDKELFKFDKSLNTFESILDFGCGCGRITQKLLSGSKTNFFGCDLDGDAILWCQKNIPEVKFIINSSTPPLPYENNSFDFIFAVSVFTHLNKEYQISWLQELNRILKPGGFLFMTINGEYSIKMINPTTNIKNIFKKKGFVFVHDPVTNELFPEFYGACYMSKYYVTQYFSKYFEVIDYVVKGNGHIQDIVMLRKSN